MVKCQTRALFVKSGRGRAMRNWRERLNKRYIGLAGVILGGLLVIALLVWLVPHNPNAVRETGQKGKSNVKYVLVNNDNGATFNGRAYNLGKDFVTLIEQDTKRDWTTASADEADAGLANGSYDVVVMIPSDFSRRLLNLNSTNPTKAGIDYQVLATYVFGGKYTAPKLYTAADQSESWWGQYHQVIEIGLLMTMFLLVGGWLGRQFASYKQMGGFTWQRRP